MEGDEIINKTPQEKIDVILSEPNTSSTVLGERLELPPSTIRSIRRQNNIRLREKFDPDVEEFERKYYEMGSIIKLSKYYKRASKTIKRFAENIGIDTSVKLLLTSEQEQEIVNAYYTRSSTELADKYGVSRSKIAQVWMQHGLSGKTTRIYNIDNESYFENIDCHAKAYYLGFIGADGCLHKHKDNRQDVLQITIQKEDIKILELLNKELKTNKPLNMSRDKYVVFSISSDLMVSHILNKGLSYQKTYGNSIANMPEKYMPSFLRGYFDGDGGIFYGKTNGDIGLAISGYEINMSKIINYLEKNNIFTTFTEDKRKYTNDEKSKFGALTFSNKTSKYCFLKMIYENKENFYLDRKWNLANNFINNIEKSTNIRDRQIVTYYNYAVQKVA